MSEYQAKVADPFQSAFLASGSDEKGISRILRLDTNGCAIASLTPESIERVALRVVELLQENK